MMTKKMQLFWLIYLFLISSTCFGRCLRPSSGALDCIYGIWYCPPLLLLAGVVDEMERQFSTFYRSRRFITAFTSARHLSLSWTSSIKSITPHPNSWRSILLLFSHLCLGLPSGLFPSGFPPKHSIRLFSPPYALQDPPVSFFSILSPEQYWAIHLMLLQI